MEVIEAVDSRRSQGRGYTLRVHVAPGRKQIIIEEPSEPVKHTVKVHDAECA